MGVNATIRNHDGVAADVTQYGQLVVGPKTNNTATASELASDDTGVMFIEPRDGSVIIITQVILAAGRDVSSNTSADVIVYESSTGAGQVEQKRLLKIPMLKNETAAFNNLNMLVGAGTWVMATTSDASVDVTILWHYLS